jgi:hypothetical protein
MRRTDRRLQRYTKFPNDRVSQDRQADWRRRITETDAAYNRWKNLPTDARTEDELDRINSSFDQTLRDFDIRDDEDMADDSTEEQR